MYAGAKEPSPFLSELRARQRLSGEKRNDQKLAVDVRTIFWTASHYVTGSGLTYLLGVVLSMDPMEV